MFNSCRPWRWKKGGGGVARSNLSLSLNHGSNHHSILISLCNENHMRKKWYFPEISWDTFLRSFLLNYFLMCASVRISLHLFLSQIPIWICTLISFASKFYLESRIALSKAKHWQFILKCSPSDFVNTSLFQVCTWTPTNQTEVYSEQIVIQMPKT